MNQINYTVVFEKAPEGGYIAIVPALPGCMTQGETFEETKEYIKDAIAAYIEVLREDGDDIPVEQSEHIAATVSVSLSTYATWRNVFNKSNLNSLLKLYKHWVLRWDVKPEFQFIVKI